MTKNFYRTFGTVRAKLTLGMDLPKRDPLTGKMYPVKPVLHEPAVTLTDKLPDDQKAEFDAWQKGCLSDMEKEHLRKL